MFVKICGLARAEDVEAVAAMGPDAMGFVFYPPSPRAVSAADVGTWTRDVPRSILRVGVFVDMPPADVEAVVETAGLDVVQLHGKERPAQYAGLMAELWKVVHLKGDGDSSPSAVPEPVAERLLIDSWTRELPGGTGKVADWALARSFVDACSQPVLLAGGLHPGNLAEAMNAVGPSGVDVSSGVEASPGQKDLAKVRDFIDLARS